MTYLQYPTFASDAVLALATAGATLQVCDRSGVTSSMTLEAFLGTDYNDFVVQRGMFLVGVVIAESSQYRPSDREFVSVTYKVAQRSTNAHAHVLAGFQFEVQRSGSSPAPVCTAVRLVFGGVSNRIFLAASTQAYLQNKELSTATLQQAFTCLQGDLESLGGGISVVTVQLVDTAYLLSVMQGCLYRGVMSCYRAADIPASLGSAIAPWVKPESRGTEVFSPSSEDAATSGEAPVGMPIPKIESTIQATGEAMYPSDALMPTQGLYAAFIYSSQCAVTLLGIDGTAALGAYPEVVAIYTAADLPEGGSNKVNGMTHLFVPLGEEVRCVGAPLGLVVASSERAANDAAARVQVTYGSTGKPVIASLDDARRLESFYPFSHIVSTVYTYICLCLLLLTSRVLYAAWGHLHPEWPPGDRSAPGPAPVQRTHLCLGPVPLLPGDPGRGGLPGGRGLPGDKRGHPARQHLSGVCVPDTEYPAEQDQCGMCPGGRRVRREAHPRHPRRRCCSPGRVQAPPHGPGIQHPHGGHADQRRQGGLQHRLLGGVHSRGSHHCITVRPVHSVVCSLVYIYTCSPLCV